MGNLASSNTIAVISFVIDATGKTTCAFFSKITSWLCGSTTIATFDFKFSSSALFPRPSAVPEDTRGATGAAFLAFLGNTVGLTSRGFLGDLRFFLDLSLLLVLLDLDVLESFWDLAFLPFSACTFFFVDTSSVVFATADSEEAHKRHIAKTRNRGRNDLNMSNRLNSVKPYFNSLS